MSEIRMDSAFNLALPFWCSLLLVPLLWITAIWGGWSFLIVIFATWILFSILDAAFGLYPVNEDPETDKSLLYWHRMITLIWAPLQFVTLFSLIWYAAQSDLSLMEKIGLFFGVGVVTGTIGINYSHELMHQSPRGERALGDFLLAMVLYSHFRSEHLLVHHRYVGTRRDAVTARYGEGFHSFFLRVLKESLVSAFRAEKEKRARQNLPWYDLSNPFFIYWGLQSIMLLLAMMLGGWGGVGLFILQAFVAIWHLELVNYVEHYGLTRKHLGEGKYEHVQPHHSWNSSHRATNWLLINLQRHSDHHYKPNRPYPLLQTYSSSEAPQLPYGYALMTAAAMFPRFWKSRMNPRVRKWREMYYPEIQDWSAYNNGTLPMPKGG